MSIKGNTNEEKIWNYIYNKIENPYGVAGLMGNLYAESGLSPINLQNTFNTKFGLTDEEYTKQVDNGTYTNFVYDAGGYGLAQWTYYNRKQNLLDFAKERGTSIGDIETQIRFLYKELKTYTSVMNVLKNATSVKEASDAVLTQYERPADQSDAVKKKRASYGQVYYDKYASAVEVKPIETDYSKYINSTTTHYISNSGSDENGKYNSGKAGDQTGKEWRLRSWYSRPWTHVFRYEKDARVPETLVRLGCAATLNDKIGYDQWQRTTYWTQLQKVGYEPSRITTACEEDCSAGVAANVKATGYLLGIKALQDVTTTMTSRSTVSTLTKAGFTMLTDSKYLTSGKYLQPGDILLCVNHHVAMNVTKGAKAGEPEMSIPTPPTVPEYPTEKAINGTAVAKGSMNIRAEASTSGASLGTIPKGTKLKVVAIVNNYWYKVVWEKSNTGYGYTSNRDNQYYTFTEDKEPANVKRAKGIPEKQDATLIGNYKVTASSLHVRNKAGTSYKSLTTIPKGTKVYCDGSYTPAGNSKWLYITFTLNNKTWYGFSHSNYLKKVKS